MKQLNPMTDFEVIEVQSLSIQCDGVGGSLGHPRVYLHIDQADGEIICPYCSRRYVLAGAPHSGDIVHAQYGA